MINTILLHWTRCDTNSTTSDRHVSLLIILAWCSKTFARHAAPNTTLPPTLRLTYKQVLCDIRRADHLRARGKWLALPELPAI